MMPDDDLIWGIHAVAGVLRDRPRQIRELTIQKGKASPKIQEIIDLARKHQLKIRFELRLRVPGGSGKVNHQGVMARMQRVATVSLDDLLAGLDDQLKPPIFLALDSIQDPHNLGAIIRSAAAVGVTAILLPKDRSAPLSGTVAKVAVGAMAHVAICTVTNLVNALKELQDHGFWVFGAAGEADQTLYEADFAGKVCLVVGGEGKGLRPLVRSQCDHLLSIPMQHGLDSLNASVATGVILFEMMRQRLAVK